MAETTVVSADGTKLAARRSGNGTPLVMVHGAMGDINSFALVEDTLAERHTVWVYSRRGRGGSGDGSEYGLEREVEDILAVLDAAGEDAHLFGHSSGAFYCLLAAPRADSLRTLSIYEPPLHVDEADSDVFDAVRSAVAAGDPDRALEIFFPIADISPQEVEMIRSQEVVWRALRDGVMVFPREHRALDADGRRTLEATQLPEVPLLYLYGELTTAPIYPSATEAARLWPRAERRCLRGQRHVAPMFDPAAFANALLDFTTAHDRS
jgi:pimeloyl-ACP methyl ester carboxylesterase